MSKNQRFAYIRCWLEIHLTQRQMGRNRLFLTCRGNVRRIPSKSCWVSRWFFVMSAFSCKPNTCQSPKTVVNQTKDSLRNLLKHCTQRVNKQGWQTLQRFKWMAFLVRTYLGMWGQRKTPDILQVTVIRTLCSDLNINRELIWCKGRKRWFLVSCKGQPKGNYLLETLSLAIFTWPICYLLIYFQTNFWKVASFLFQMAAGKNPCFYKPRTREQTAFQCLSTIVPMSCPDANSIVIQEGTRKRIKLRSYNNLSFIYTDSMNLQIFSARSSKSAITVLCPVLTFLPSGLPLGEKSSHQQFADHQTSRITGSIVLWRCNRKNRDSLLWSLLLRASGLNKVQAALGKHPTRT